MKYFLVCPNCGHQNDALSEYLTFCDTCKKKLSNNFREWKKNHPEKSLQAFFIDACIDENEAAQKAGAKEKKQSRKPLRIIGNPKIAIALAVFLVVAGLAFISINNLLNSAKKFEAISFNWKRDVYGDYGLSLECPVEAESIDMTIPSGNSTTIQRVQAFASDPKKELSVMLISTEFKKGMGQVNIQASISGFIYRIKAMPGISELKVEQNETLINGIKGFEQNGTFLNNGIPASFKSIGISQGMILWQVMVVHLDEDERLEGAKERIFNSIEILYNTAI